MNHMLALEVRLNGRKVALAGAEDLCILSTNVTAVGKLGAKSRGSNSGRRKKVDMHLNVGGLTSRALGKANENLTWVRLKPLRPGDEVHIRLVSTAKTDPPSGRYPAEDNKRKDDQERCWFEMAKEAYFKLKGKYEKGAR
jgi:hypothetical protein